MIHLSEAIVGIKNPPATRKTFGELKVGDKFYRRESGGSIHSLTVQRIDKVLKDVEIDLVTSETSNNKERFSGNDLMKISYSIDGYNNDRDWYETFAPKNAKYYKVSNNIAYFT